MTETNETKSPETSATSGKGLRIASWVSRLVVVAIFVMGALPKFTGNADVLDGKLPGGDVMIYVIGVMEVIAIVLLLVPRTVAIGAALAALIMLGAIASHLFGPVGMEGDAAGMFPLAVVAFLGAAVTLFLKRHELPGVPA